VIWITAIVIILAAFAGILYMKSLTDQTAFLINDSCPTRLT